MALRPIDAIDLTTVAGFEAALAEAETAEQFEVLARLVRMSWAGQVFAGSDVWLSSPWHEGRFETHPELRAAAVGRAMRARDLLEELHRRTGGRHGNGGGR